MLTASEMCMIMLSFSIAGKRVLSRITQVDGFQIVTRYEHADLHIMGFYTVFCMVLRNIR